MEIQDSVRVDKPNMAKVRACEAGVSGDPSTRTCAPADSKPAANLAAMTRQRDPFANFDRMRRQIDELFGDVWTRAGLSPHRRAFSPRVDVYYTGDPPTAVVKADLAGLRIDDISLEIRGRVLVISGERKARETEGRVYQQIEIEHGPFQREIQLGVDVVADQARATYEDGILRVELPVADSQEAREVPITLRDEESTADS
jgi:HSP20 family protein